MRKASLAPILSAILAEKFEHTCCQLHVLRSLPATRIRWNTAAWMCHTLISTWKKHHFCWSPILLLGLCCPNGLVFRHWGTVVLWLVLMKPHGSFVIFCLTLPCAGFFRTSDPSSSGADLSGTALRQNIWKHRETLPLLHAFRLPKLFLGVKNRVIISLPLHLMFLSWHVFEISTPWSASTASEHSMVLPVTLYELCCQVAICKVSFAPKERLARASRLV